MKVTELLKESDYNFDSKNITNKGLGIVSDEIVNQIESSGITSELLNSFPFPVFRYKTQITLHGTFKNLDFSYKSTGGYKNLIINKNNSLGVRYSAIDIHKKKLIAKILRLEQSRFSLHLDSSICTVASYLRYSEANIETMKQVFKLLPTNYIGFSQLYISNSMFGKFVVIRIVLNAILETEFYSFLSQLLQKPYSKDIYEANLAQKELNDQIERKKYELEREQHRIEANSKFESLKSEFLSKNNIKFIHSFNEGRYLFFNKESDGELRIEVLHIYKNRGRLMRYTEQVNDISSIPATSTTHYNRRLLDNRGELHIKDRLQKDFYFKLVS